MIRKLFFLFLIILAFPAMAQKAKSSNVLGQDLAPLKVIKLQAFIEMDIAELMKMIQVNMRLQQQ